MRTAVARINVEYIDAAHCTRCYRQARAGRAGEARPTAKAGTPAPSETLCPEPGHAEEG